MGGEDDGLHDRVHRAALGVEPHRQNQREQGDEDHDGGGVEDGVVERLDKVRPREHLLIIFQAHEFRLGIIEHVHVHEAQLNELDHGIDGEHEDAEHRGQDHQVRTNLLMRFLLHGESPPLPRPDPERNRGRRCGCGCRPRRKGTPCPRGCSGTPRRSRDRCRPFP